MESVPRETVVRYWLDRELRKREDDPDVARLDTDAAVDALLREKPGVADVVWDRDDPDWYRLSIPRERFQRLRLVGGPPRLLWRALSPDGTVMGAAERVASEPAETLRRDTGVDVGTVLAYREALAAGETLDPLVIATRRGCAPWHVADGNHRAVAVGVRLLETGEYDPQLAFLAVAPNPVLRPALERLCGLVRRLR